MIRFDLTAAQKTLLNSKHRTELKPLILATAIFFGVMLVLALNRYQVFAGYDHGLFNQIFWNNLHGRFFQGSLTGGNSSSVLQDGQVPDVASLHLGQHFVPDFLLWLPFYALFPHPITLVVLQVALMTAGGLVLYPLARHYLQPRLALMITASYYAASAVIGPTFDNFYEQCQIPLLTFGMLLAMEKQRWLLFWLLAVLVLGIREDAGFVLFSIGLYLALSRRHPRVGLALCVLSFSYVVAVTTVVMPQFSHDNSRLYLANRYKDFVPGNPNPSSLQILWGLISHPVTLLKDLLLPFDRRFFYLFELWVPLAFIPAISAATWLLVGIPLLALFVQTSPIALTITIRYAVAIVPGLFYGAIIWWAAHTQQFKPMLRRFWIGCIALSVIILISLNPGRAFYFLFPDAVLAQFSVPIVRQWEHTRAIEQVIAAIPPNATVSTTTYLIPRLSNRRGLLRLSMMQLQNDQGQIVNVDYIAADLWYLQHPQGLPKFDLSRLKTALSAIDQVVAASTYGVLDFRDGVVLLQQGVRSNPTASMAWTQFREHLPPLTDHL